MLVLPMLLLLLLMLPYGVVGCASRPKTSGGVVGAGLGGWGGCLCFVF
jgi:hypothetical protein